MINPWTNLNSESPYTYCLDEQLITLFNVSASDIGKIFDELVQYTASHFSDEEALQARANYPDINNHKEVHKKLVAKVLEYGEQLKAGKLQAADLMRFLSDWLINHIQGTDSKYVPYVKKVI